MRSLLFALSLLPGLVLANPPHHDGHPPHGEFRHHFKGDGEHLPRFLHDIDLSEQQRNDIKSLLQAHASTAKENWSKHRALKTQLRQLSFSADFSDYKASALIEQGAALHQSEALERAKLDHAIFNLLTNEQQAVLKSKLEKFEDDKPF